jgi:hypothetical protein
MDEIADKINTILEKIDNLETTLISINKDLIAQNIKLSEVVYPNYINKNLTNENEDIEKEKELFYEEIDTNLYNISGSGTYDNKDKIKTNGGTWDKSNKCWTLYLDIQKIQEIFPKIKKKP